MAAAAAALARARRGPLYRHLPPTIPAEEWAAHGDALYRHLTAADSGDGDSPTAAEAATAAAAAASPLAPRIFDLYLPIYFWCRAQVRAARAAHPDRAVGIGLSAPQGCGKTTLVNLLTARFAADGLSCAAVSFDDFYLTGADQDALAAAHPDNPLLQVRGNAGTHDLDLGTSTIDALLRRDPAGVAVPRYDKSQRGGRGDRAPAAAWSTQATPADVVLLEGWMAGFSPVAAADVAALGEPGLDRVNELLGQYAAWHDRMSAWAVLGVDDANHVFRWRLEAEQAMAAAGRPGMDDDAVRDFVSRYMPAYRAYLPGLYTAAAGDGVAGKPTLFVRVGGQRQVIGEDGHNGGATKRSPGK
jgi:D-glycerate 3-kinase